jgi:hypothetical protein
LNRKTREAAFQKVDNPSPEKVRCYLSASLPGSVNHPGSSELLMMNGFIGGRTRMTAKTVTIQKGHAKVGKTG